MQSSWEARAIAGQVLGATGVRNLLPEFCSINTVTLGRRAPIAEKIEAIARAGFGGIAPWRSEMEHVDIAATARRIRDAGLRVSSYCRSSYLTASTSEGFRTSIEDNQGAIDEAAMLGAAVMILVVGGLSPGSKDLSRARGQVEEGIALLLEHGRRQGVRLAIEPLHPMHLAERSCINTLSHALAICDRLESQPSNGAFLGVCVDAYHCWWDPELPSLLRQAGRARRIFNFQICDWLVPTHDMLLDRGMMGDGVIDLPSIRAEIEAAGYQDFVEIEIFSANDWWERSASETLATCRERIATCC